MDNKRLSQLIGKIYDSAVDPDNWESALAEIRDKLDLAFISMNYMYFPPTYPSSPPDMRTFITEWDQDWIDALPPLVPLIPHFDEMKNADLDQPVTQLSLMDETDFRQSEFYDKWVKPQGLRDTCNINVILRERQNAMLSATIRDNRGVLTETELDLLNTLSPHLRRAMLISDLVDESRSWIEIYHQLLDNISVAVILVGSDSRILYHNAAADAMLSAAKAITARQGTLTAVSPAHQEGLKAALHRACSEDDKTIGTWGNGMLLPDNEGNSIVAYALPLGKSERRRALGPGLAAVFLTSDQSAKPPSFEVLSALSGLTSAEANVAIAVAEGKSPEKASQESGISVHTFRKHLANIYDKTGIRSQTALGAFVNRLSLPVETSSGSE